MMQGGGGGGLCLVLSYLGNKGKWGNTSDLCLLYLDDYYINFTKKIFQEKSSNFGNSYIPIQFYPLTLQLVSNLYLMIFTFILKNLPKILKKSSKLQIECQK